MVIHSCSWTEGIGDDSIERKLGKKGKIGKEGENGWNQNEKNKNKNKNKHICPANVSRDFWGLAGRFVACSKRVLNRGLSLFELGDGEKKTTVESDLVETGIF